MATVVVRSDAHTPLRTLTRGVQVLLDDDPLGRLQPQDRLTRTVPVGTHVFSMTGQSPRWEFDIGQDGVVEIVLHPGTLGHQLGQPFDAWEVRVLGATPRITRNHPTPSARRRRLRWALPGLLFAWVLGAALTVPVSWWFGESGAWPVLLVSGFGSLLPTMIILVAMFVVPQWLAIRRAERAATAPGADR